MQVLFSVSCLLAAASAGLVYPSSSYQHHYNGGELLNNAGSLYAGPYGHASHHAVEPHGVPHDTEEVAAAKAVHFAAHAEAKARHTLQGHGVQQNELIDTPEVQIAKYQHQVAHAEAKERLMNPGLAHGAVPVETQEVQVAKHEHFAAHAEAKLRDVYPTLAHAHHTGPMDTPEVQQAKVEHAHAHAQAQQQQQQQVYGYDHQHQYQYQHTGHVLDIPVYGHYSATPAHYGHHGW